MILSVSIFMKDQHQKKYSVDIQESNGRNSQGNFTQLWGIPRQEFCKIRSTKLNYVTGYSEDSTINL